MCVAVLPRAARTFEVLVVVLEGSLVFVVSGSEVAPVCPMYALLQSGHESL